MNTARIGIFLCILACGGLLLAQGPEPGRRQGPRPKPEMTAWWDQPIARDLGLTDAQEKQIRATVAQSRDRLIELKAAVDKAEGVLRDLMNQDKIDTAKAETAIEKVVTTHADMMRAVSLMSLKLRAVLTSEQWQQLERRESQPPPPRPGEPGKRGPAGPPPPRD